MTLNMQIAYFNIFTPVWFTQTWVLHWIDCRSI